MKERTFDLTVPVTRQFRMIWWIMGILQIFNGLMSVIREEGLLASLQLAFGLFILAACFFMPRINKYIIAFCDEDLEISRGIFKHRKIPWALISEIHIKLMSVEFRVNEESMRRSTSAKWVIGKTRLSNPQSSLNSKLSPRPRGFQLETVRFVDCLLSF